LNVLEKITKLLALAKSPEIEEARNASHRAALLILEHKIELRVPGAGQVGGFFEAIFGKSYEDVVREAARATAEEVRARTAHVHANDINFKSPSGKTPRPASAPSKWKQMSARHKGICQACGKCINRHDDIFFKKGAGARHGPCHQATQL
jgi:hypothetical protein